MSGSDNNKKKVTSKQVVAMCGVILLVLLYIATLLAAIFDTSASANLFWVCLMCTIIVPIIIWIYTWLWGRLHDKSDSDSSIDE